MDDFTKMKPKDIVCLTDDQTISDLMEAKAPNAMDGLQLTIINVRHIREESGLADWYLANLDVRNELPFTVGTPLTLMVKIVDETTDLRIYFTPDDVAPGTRVDQLESHNQWLFSEPDDADDFVPGDLEMARTIDQNVDDVDIVYTMKGGTFHGELFESPKLTGIRQPQFVSITEYVAADDQDNPELVILEVGGLTDNGNPNRSFRAEGGLVTMLQGAGVSPNDVTLMSV